MTLSIIPISSEKAYGALTSNQYVFYVPLTASKDQIAKEIEAQFKVTVLDVKTLIRKGKPVSFSRGKRRYPGTTYAKSLKKAYVTLKSGDKIKVFDEEAPAEESSDKKDKKAEKEKK